MVLGINCGSNCYSTESIKVINDNNTGVLNVQTNNVINGNNIDVIHAQNNISNNLQNNVDIPLINYNDNNLPTDEQMLKYKNVLPITFNNLEKVRNCLHWLYEHQSNDNEVIKKLLFKLYNICNDLSCASCTHWGNIDDCIESFWETEYSWNRGKPRDYNTVAPTEEPDNRINTLFGNIKINIAEIHNVISTILKNGQVKLNPEKYKDFTVPQNQDISVTQAFYYISNQLVQLSQDIIYNIDKQIENKKDNNRLKIKSTVIDPCYNVLKDAMSELNSSVNHILENNNNLNNISKLKKSWKHMFRQMELDIKIQDFKTDYLDKYAVDSSYCQSKLKSCIYDVEKKVIEIINKHKEQFTKKTEKINTKQAKQFQKFIFDEIQRKLNDEHFNYEKEMKKIITNLTSTENNMNDEEMNNKVNIQITNEEITNNANKYLMSMFNNIESVITDNASTIKQYWEKEAAQYKDEMDGFINKIKEESTNNKSQYEIPNKTYVDNIKQLLAEYSKE